MPKQIGSLEVNTFVGGLVTDASPLTFPDNASIEEVNFVLDTDGTRSRRLGMDLEDSATTITTGLTFTSPIGQSSFRWENAGGDPDKSLLVVQFGNQLKFFDLDNLPISSQVIATITFATTTFSNTFSYAQVDGTLVVANGDKDIQVFTFDDAMSTITNTQQILETRDLFGVEDIVSSVNIRASNNVSLRPTTQTTPHLYNLRNQSWGIPRRDETAETLKDPISEYKGVDGNKLPSNADTVTLGLFPDAASSGDKLVDRFHPNFIKDNPIGNSHAAVGHFIIDALERGTSRKAAYDGMISKFSSTSLINIGALSLDRTPGGASVVTQYSGHIFYSGFNGEVISGDEKSPRMSSYVFFSKLVRDISDIGACFQEGDPTSADSPGIVASDGGFIRIDEAFGIKAMAVEGNSLFVLAQNGIWRISGDDQAGFKASGFDVSKITERGITGAKTVISAEGTITYWGDDGIYNISRNEFGDWNATNISFDRIQTFYDAIDSVDKLDAQGIFDSYERKMRWVYGNALDTTSDVKELILDSGLNAFYKNSFKTPDGTTFPIISGLFESSPFSAVPTTSDVVVGGDPVVVGGDQVIISQTALRSVIRSIKYIIVTAAGADISYSFGAFTNTEFCDFFSVDGVGKDAAAIMITGYLSGGDFQRQKQIPLMTIHMRKTETGFELINGQLEPVNASSCKVQVQWAWSDDAASGRWSKEFQAYRFRRLFIPQDVTDTFETGQVVVTTKNKIRGKGRVLSIQFKTEPKKDLQLLGWGFVVGIMQSV